MDGEEWEEGARLEGVRGEKRESSLKERQRRAEPSFRAAPARSPRRASLQACAVHSQAEQGPAGAPPSARRDYTELCVCASVPVCVCVCALPTPCPGVPRREGEVPPSLPPEPRLSGRKSGMAGKQGG